jgi:hypothetical protein
MKPVLSFQAQDEVGVSKVAVKLEIKDRTVAGFSGTLFSGTNKDGVWRVNLSFTGSNEIGNWKIYATAWDAAGNQSKEILLREIPVQAASTPTPTPKIAQKINFTKLIDWEPNRAQTLTAQSSSGLAVTYTSLTPQVCSIISPSSGPTVQRQPKLPDAPFWACTIRANQSGDARFEPAPPIEQTFNFLKARTEIRVTTTSNLSGAGPHSVLSTFRYVDSSMMSGLTSLGQLLTVSSLTPTVCAVRSNDLWDRSGGIINRTGVEGVSNGSCSLKFEFPGSASMLPSTLTWNVAVSSIVVPTGSAITVQAISGNVVSGKEVVGEMPSSSPIMYLSGLDKGRVQLNLGVVPKNPAATIGLNSQRKYESANYKLKVKIDTPSTCKFESGNPTSVLNDRVFLIPIKIGTCSVRFDFLGIPSWGVEPSSFTWSAAIYK